MKRQRRSFSPEFKHDAASLVLDQGYSYTEAGRAVDVHENTLCKWVQQLEAERNGNTPKSKALTDEQQRIQELDDTIELALEQLVEQFKQQAECLNSQPDVHASN